MDNHDPEQSPEVPPDPADGSPAEGDSTEGGPVGGGPQEPEAPLPEPADVRGADVEEFVNRAQHGDADALNSLFERYYGLLVEVARKRLGTRLKQKEEADDLAQTTFREATRDFDRYQYRGEGSLLRWLIQILNNKIRDRAEFYSAGKRDMARERNMEGESESGRRIEPPSPDLSVTRQVSREEEFGVLRQALERLSPEHRTAITLVFFQGLTLREAGERMDGRSEDAVRMLLRRAEARLKDLVAGRLENPE